MREARRASWWSPYGLFRLFAYYYIGALTLSYLVAQIRYLAYRKHFRHLDGMEWLDYL